MPSLDHRRLYRQSLPARAAVYSGDNPLSVIATDFVPDIDADEQTIRAREAVIATGFFPGADEIIRSGGLDHSHCLQTALELQRSLSVPLERLPLRQHTRIVIVEQNQFSRRRSRLARWWTRVQRQIAYIVIQRRRLIQRADRLAVKLLETEAEVNALRRENERVKRQKAAATGVPARAIPTTHRLQGEYVPHYCAACGGGLGHHPVKSEGAIKCPGCHATNYRRVTLSQEAPAGNYLDYFG